MGVESAIEQVVFKRDLLDDPDPTLVQPPVSRLFNVSAFALNGALASELAFRCTMMDPTRATIAGASDLRMYLNLSGVWTLVGFPIRGMPSHQVGSVALGGLPAANVLGFLRMTSIIAAGATQIEQVVLHSASVP
jgi:hypothetical protein